MEGLYNHLKNLKVIKKCIQNSDRFFILSNFRLQSRIKGVMILLKWGSGLFTSLVQYFCKLWWTFLSKFRCYLGGTYRKTLWAQQILNLLHSGASAFISFFLSENKTPGHRSRLSEMYSKKTFSRLHNNIFYCRCNNLLLHWIEGCYFFRKTSFLNGKLPIC